MIVLAILFLQLLKPTQILANCDTKCGDIKIDYPFGTDPSCAYHEGFELTCYPSYQPPKLFLGNGPIEVLNISLQDGTISVKTKVVSSIQPDYNDSWSELPTSGPYSLSTSQNKFVAIGCGVLAELTSPQITKVISACASICVSRDGNLPTDGVCTGIGCCETSIQNTSLSSSTLNFELKSFNQTPSLEVGLENMAFIVERRWFSLNAPILVRNFSNGSAESTAIPALLDWRIGNSDCKAAIKNSTSYACKSENSSCSDYNNGTGYRCSCPDGYQGNPYVKDGCKDIDECKHPELYPCNGDCVNSPPGSYECVCPQGMDSADQKAHKCVSGSKGKIPLSGVLIIIGVGIFVCLLSLPIAVTMLMYKLRARRAKKLKEKFYEQNRGFLLEQLISKNQDIAERLKVFNLEELEKATHRFDRTRIVGSGGHGTVYKGILSDQRVVAIKKSKIRVQREINEFINEVVILSEINHRNIVKLFGCCLETEVPLLVYEFIPNGALSEHLHKDSNKCLPWEDRLRIALETSRALAYLHTSASNSIFHRDIKTANILLDDNLTAKLSDFGASRSVPVNQSGVTTVIQGTYGYLDPEYYYTGRLTDKSDVYSFGVILVELLTREVPVSCSRFPDGGNLAANFMMVMKEDRLTEILDPQVVEEVTKVEINAVAKLAEMCLNFSGEERPTMKQVEMKLEKLQNRKSSPRRRSMHPWTPGRLDEGGRLFSAINGCGSSCEMTRQYSLEEEFLVENYPR